MYPDQTLDAHLICFYLHTLLHFVVSTEIDRIDRMGARTGLCIHMVWSSSTYMHVLTHKKSAWAMHKTMSTHC